MKKIFISLITIGFICTFMTSCSNNATQEKTEETNETTEQTSDTTSEEDATVSEETSDTTDTITNTTDTSNDVVAGVPSETTSVKHEKGDVVDLTVLSGTMVFSEVYNMMTTPQNYEGVTVKMTGQFQVYEDAEKGKTYYAVIIPDATGCCQQGFEFILKDEKSLDDYPPIGTEITVSGTFESYEEDGTTFCHLIDAVMTVN